jgi:hypothetical protein
VSSTKVPDIPEVPASADPSLRKFLDAVRQVVQVREGNRGDPLDAVVTYRDLIDGGFASYVASNRDVIISPSVIADFTQPPLVEDFTVSGALTALILSWTAPIYKNHAHTEIWRASIPDITQASQVGMSSGSIFTDYVGKNTTGFKYYYWARHVSIYGIKGEFNTVPKLGETSPDPAALIELLTGQLTESNLYSTLLDRINLIDDSKTYITSVSTRIEEAKEVIDADLADLSNVVTTSNTLLSQQIGQVSTDLTNTTKSLTDSDTSIIQSISTLSSNVANTYATKTSLNTTAATLNTAIATSNTTLNTKVDNLSATVNNNYTALTTKDAALTSSISSLSSNVSNNYATKTELSTTAATLSGSIAGTDSTLTAKFNNVSADLMAETTARTNADAKIVSDTAASISTVNTAIANTNTSLANVNTTLSARLNNVGGTSSGVTIEQAYSAQADVNTGLYAQYSVKINNSTNKFVTGFGLSSTTVNGETVGEFAIIADKFSIAPVATSATAVDGSPFYYLTAPTVVNGVTVPAGAYMKKAFIADATIGTAQIADAAITSAKISSLTADKITFNDAAGQRFSAAVITGGTIQGTTITGNTISGGSISGTTISGGTITGTTINGGEVYVPKALNLDGTPGWKFKVDSLGRLSATEATISGNITATSGSFSGTLDVKSAQTGARLEIKNNVIKVYDEFNTLRVQIGDLSA